MRNDVRCRVLGLFLAFALCLMSPLLVQAQTLSLYDDFSGGGINAAKWQNLEVVREIRSGKLVSGLRAAGPSPINNSLLFANPSAVQSFHTEARITSATLPTAGDCGLRLRGSFYNDGTTGSGALGDVRAELYALEANTGGQVGYVVYRCTNSDCSTLTYVIAPTIVKAITIGETHTLGIAWDGSFFTFTVDGLPTVVNPRLVQPVVNPTPQVSLKMLTSQVTIFPPGGTGSVAGEFDNVYVNGALYDDFSGTRLDPAKWDGANLELVREISGGRLVSKVTAADTALLYPRNRIRFVNTKAVKTLQADVTVTNSQSVGSSVSARLFGTFYNDGASTSGTDQTGDVAARLQIASSNGGSLNVNVLIDRCLDPQCNSSTTFGSFTLGTVNLNETHTLFLQWTGSVFVYGMDGVTASFDPSPYYPPAKPPADPFSEFRTHVLVNTDGGIGHIAATVDNVYVNDEAMTLPGLAPFYQTALAGDVASAGVGLRGTGSGTINLTGIPRVAQ
jgi:hypothetical protein